MCICVCKCNAKVIFVETVPGIGGGEIMQSSGGVSSHMLNLIHCKNFCKCHNVPPPITTIKGKKRTWAMI
jgi:hypothetical protein